MDSDYKYMSVRHLWGLLLLTYICNGDTYSQNISSLKLTLPILKFDHKCHIYGDLISQNLLVPELCIVKIIYTWHWRVH